MSRRLSSLIEVGMYCRTRDDRVYRNGCAQAFRARYLRKLTSTFFSHQVVLDAEVGLECFCIHNRMSNARGEADCSRAFSEN